MNLYKIVFSHHAPKDSEIGIKALLLAENDEQVYEWIKSEPEINSKSLYNGWGYSEKDNEEFEIYNDEYEVVGRENFKQKMMRLKGQINDEDYDFSDSYYGITLLGWELLKDDVKTDYNELIELGIVFILPNQ